MAEKVRVTKHASPEPIASSLLLSAMILKHAAKYIFTNLFQFLKTKVAEMAHNIY
jgi:hypothetical protein